MSLHLSLPSRVESILFVAGKPLTFGVIGKALGVGEADVRDAVEMLKAKYNHDESGLRILSDDASVQMATNPAHADTVETFIKEEAAGELTRAQLETLTVVAYRGPITRPELEQIRGVNCAVILRNLLVRGLVEEKDDAGKHNK